MSYASLRYDSSTVFARVRGGGTKIEKMSTFQIFPNYATKEGERGGEIFHFLGHFFPDCIL